MIRKHLKRYYYGHKLGRCWKASIGTSKCSPGGLFHEDFLDKETKEKHLRNCCLLCTFSDVLLQRGVSNLSQTALISNVLWHFYKRRLHFSFNLNWRNRKFFLSRMNLYSFLTKELKKYNKGKKNTACIELFIVRRLVFFVYY